VYLRFITQFVNEDGQTQRGFFNALAYIQNHLSTSDEDKEKLDAIYRWFKENLDAPEWFKKPEYRQHEYHSISWFKDSAKEHILKIQEAMEILEKYDLIVERVTTKKPGRIFFEDKYQISAVPFSKKRKTVI
jgi:hypothetical protein